MNKTAGHTGFTLLEVMVAVAIFSIVVFTIFSSYQAFISSGKRIQSSIHDGQSGRIAFNRFNEDFKNICIIHPPQYQPPEFESEPDPFRLFGSQESQKGMAFSKLIFASKAGLLSNNKSINRVIYFVRENSSGRFDLCRSQVSVGNEQVPDPCHDPVLVKNIVKFDLVFSDDEGEIATEWDSDSKENSYEFPSLVDIKMVVAQADKTVVYRSSVKLPVQRGDG